MSTARRLVLSHGLNAVAMSAPWPALLVMTWEQTHSDAWLAVVGGARVAPYIVLSWYVGSLGDRFSRDRVLRATTYARILTLMVSAAALLADQLVVAVVAATVTVAVGTPAYPALAAALPDVAPRGSDRATRWLVTAEVGGFVAGPAMGGLLMAGAGAQPTVLAAVGLAAAGGLVMARTPRVRTTTGRGASFGYAAAVRQLARRRVAVLGVGVVVATNMIDGALAVGLLALFSGHWAGGGSEFGLTTAAYGTGAVLAPALCAALRLPAASQIRPLLLLSAGLMGVLAAPGWQWALVPLAVAGALSTQVECAVTIRIQDAMPRGACASALGIADTAMVAASLAGAAAAPFLIRELGGTAFLLGLVGLSLIVLPLVGSVGERVALSRLPAAPAHPQSRSQSGGALEECTTV